MALFIGIIVGTYSSIFLAPAFLVELRSREPEVAAHTAQVLRERRGEDPHPGRGRRARTAIIAAEDDQTAEELRDGSHGNAGDSEEDLDAGGFTSSTSEVDGLEPEESSTEGEPAVPRERHQPRRSNRRQRSTPRGGRR